MRLERLALTNVRTFRELDMRFGGGLYVVAGPNASGKTNLLEAIALLATARSARARADAELISEQSLRGDPLPAARFAAEAATADGPVSVEVAIVARNPGEAAGRAAATGRRFRVNGVARRASDLIGRLRVTPFSADDLEIVGGSPGRRRRWLDVAISQLDAAYVRALQRYQRVLQQRNVLLRRLQERRGRAAGELEFWDGELAASGGTILAARASALRALAPGADERHRQLAPDAGPLEADYRPRLPPEAEEAVLRGGGADGEEAASAARAVFGEALRAARDGDLAAGVTRAGPHRDDVRFAIGGREAGAFASRGEQRTLALALRLAEIALSRERTGEPPLLLLDDVLSELDAARRARVLEAVREADQAILTTPDADRPGPDELPGALRYRIEGGALVPADPPP